LMNYPIERRAMLAGKVNIGLHIADLLGCIAI
jgi:hypothetical protein